MKKNNLKNKSITAFFWDLSGNVANQGVSFLISIVLARILAPEEFGLIAMVNIIFIFSNALLDVGLGAALVQRKRLLPIHFTSVFYFNLSLGLFLTFITYSSATQIANFYQQKILIPLIQVMSISFVLNAINIVQNIQLKRSLNLKQTSILRVSSNILSGLTGIIMAYSGFGVWSLLVQLLLNKLIYTLLLWISVKWVPQFAFSLKALKQLWRYGFNVFIANILYFITAELDVLIIGKLFPASTLGYYQRAKSLDKMIVQFSSASLNQVMFPVFSSLQTEIDRIKNVFIRSMHLLNFIIFFLVGVFYLCAEHLIILLYTEKWLFTVDYFKIIILAGFTGPLSSLFINVIMGRGNSKNNLKLALIKKIPQGLNLIIGFMWGINGFLYGLIVVNIINLLMNIHFCNKELKTGYLWFFKPIYPPLLLSIVSVVIINWTVFYFSYPNHLIMFLFKGFSFLLLYLSLSYLFKFESLNIVVSEIKSIIKK